MLTSAPTPTFRKLFLHRIQWQMITNTSLEFRMFAFCDSRNKSIPKLLSELAMISCRLTMFNKLNVADVSKLKLLMFNGSLDCFNFEMLISSRTFVNNDNSCRFDQLRWPNVLNKNRFTSNVCLCRCQNCSARNYSRLMVLITKRHSNRSSHVSIKEFTLTRQHF